MIATSPLPLLLSPPDVWLVDKACAPDASAAWLQPGHWPDATPVGQGGRGGAWFVSTPHGPAVLRQYWRGGLMARLSQRRFFWAGRERVRCVGEFALLQAMQAKHLPVPAPLVAAAWRDGLTYEAALLMRRIEAVGSFHQQVQHDAQGAPWEAVGRTLAAFHRLGFRHADLNAFNLLIDGVGQVWVIDWDRGREVPVQRGWIDAVLARLQRGLLKHRDRVSEDAINIGMERLRAAHDEALA